jgi:hypothetical protein
MRTLLPGLLAAAYLWAQTLTLDANGGYRGLVGSARARGLEIGIGVPGSCDGPVISAKAALEKVEAFKSLRGSVCFGTRWFAPRWYLHAGPVLARDPGRDGEAGVGLWGAVLITPSLYAGLDARSLWARRATEHEFRISVGWPF